MEKRASLNTLPRLVTLDPTPHLRLGLAHYGRLILPWFPTNLWVVARAQRPLTLRPCLAPPSSGGQKGLRTLLPEKRHSWSYHPPLAPSSPPGGRTGATTVTAADDAPPETFVQ